MGAGSVSRINYEITGIALAIMFVASGTIMSSDIVIFMGLLISVVILLGGLSSGD